MWKCIPGIPKRGAVFFSQTFADIYRLMKSVLIAVSFNNNLGSTEIPVSISVTKKMAQMMASLVPTHRYPSK